MSQREPQRPLPEPARLSEDREIGKLISQANGTYRGRLDESGAFLRLSERLERPERGWHWRGLALGTVLSAAAAGVLVFGESLFGESLFDDGQSRVALGPELSTSRRMPSDGREPSEQQPSEPEVSSPPLAAGRAKLAASDIDGNATDPIARSAVPPARPAVTPPRPAVPSPRERPVARGEASARPEPSSPNGDAEAQVVAAPELAARPGPERADGVAKNELEGSTRADVGHASSDGLGAAPAMAASAEAPSSAARAVEARLDCSDLLRKDARAAEHCYAQRAAESSGLSAEAALYELARLRRDVQQDAKGALAALNEYRDRFPRGSLRNEVGLSRVELLSELGRSREALNEAEALLGSAKGGERAAELHLLRGDIFRRDLADFAQAAQEYTKAEKFGGGFGAEATRLRGLSLEALGDVEGALAAYRRYLSGPDQPRKGEVHRRVEALTSSQRGTTP